MVNLVVKSNIKKKVKELQIQSKLFENKEEITSVADEVGREMEKRTEEILIEALKRAKANGRRTLQARDL